MSSHIPDVSVVVPIYNVEQYLRECVDSILAQTHKNIEVILVNDGSTDGSLEIMREYEASDSRVVVVDKPNGGYGHSVNRGIETATGTWLSIIEPDDIIDMRMYSDLLKNATLKDGTLADIVKSSYWLYYDHEDGTAPYTHAPNLMRFMPGGRCVLEKRNLRELLFHHPSIWSAIYRRDFIEKHHIRMIEPKGAGWADNPWFLDTVLQAESIVWWPRAYYFYRQTNPGASSKSPALELPFDRLRDMREIIANADLETDENTIIPFYNRSFCYILDSVLDEYGYSESDSEVQELIREVLESMDKKTVLKAKFGIPAAHKSYYKDVMGIHLDELQKVPSPTQPHLSLILAMHEEKQGLWPTVLSLTNQRFSNFEVICVDTGSHNRFADIVQDISQIDGRFSLIQLGEEASIADAFNAGMEAAKGEYIQFWRPGITYPYRTDLAHIFKKADKKTIYVDPLSTWIDTNDENLSDTTPYLNRPKNADLIMMTESLLTDFLPTNAEDFNEVKVLSFPPVGVQDRLAPIGDFSIYGKIFSRSFLQEKNLTHKQLDEDGRLFSLAAIDCAELVTLVRGGSPNCHAFRSLSSTTIESAEELLSSQTERITLLSEQVAALEDKHAGYVALMKEFDDARYLVFSEYADSDFFGAMATAFKKAFADADLSVLDIAQFEHYNHLRQFFEGDYGELLKKEVSTLQSAYRRERDANHHLHRELAHTRHQLRVIRNSISFKTTKAVKTGIKAVLPIRRKSGPEKTPAS